MEGAEAPNVEWRIIAGFDNYDVSNTGLVRNRTTNRILAGNIGSRGYPMVILSGRTKDIHKLVASAFIGDSEGREVDHIDRNRRNNNVSNLRYVTRGDNQRNRSGVNGVAYVYVDNLPDNAIIVTEYGNHRFDNLFYIPGAGEFYFFNGVQYRMLPYATSAQSQTFRVRACNVENRVVDISVSKYRRMIDDLP
jgi:hypothetical protein